MNVIYSDIINPVNERCPISLESFTHDMVVTQILYCRHLFTPNNFTQWFSSNVRCPICRYDIRTYNPNTRYSLYNNYVNNNIEDNLQNDSFTSPSSEGSAVSPITNHSHVNNNYYDEEIELNQLTSPRLNQNNEEHIENEYSYEEIYDEEENEEEHEEENEEENEEEHLDSNENNEYQYDQQRQEELLEQVFNNQIPSFSQLIINSANNDNSNNNISNINTTRYLEEFLDNQLTTMAREIQNFNNQFGDNIDLQLTAETTIIRDMSDNLV